VKKFYSETGIIAAAWIVVAIVLASVGVALLWKS
jgi:hypothetical protein